MRIADVGGNLLKVEKVKTLFHQFNVLNSIRFLCVELVRKVLDSNNIFGCSYSQTGEDRIITSILDPRIERTGFYVDVGCNHPQFFSNTFALYKRGWTGITIDANKELIQKHQRLRRRDISICAVVSDREKECTFTDFDQSLFSSINTERISKVQEKFKIKEQRIVNTVLLSTILDRYEVPKHFDLLSIDVEGHDFEVLSSLNLSIYRPKLIVIELHEFDFLNPSSSKIYNYLTANNYRLIGYIILNGYFLDTSRTPIQ